MEISFYLKRPQAKEPTSIFARISYFGLQLKYYPSEKITPKYWNKTEQKARQTFEGYSNFNKRLSDIKSCMEDVLRAYQNSNNNAIPTPEELKGLLDAKLKNIQSKAGKHTFFTFFKEIIDSSKNGTRLHHKTGKPISPNTIKTYVTTFTHISNFQMKLKKKIDFNSIDLDFYHDYIKYLTMDLILASNTIGKHVQVIKLIMNEATERGLNTNLAHKSKRFITVREDVDSIYLNEKELNGFENIDLSKEPRLEKVRDLFLIGCYTGLRFSDFSILKPEDIVDGYIDISQTKTSGGVVIPLHEKVKKILEKYNGKLPRALTNQRMNDYLKEIAKRMDELHKKVTIKYTKGGQPIIENIEKYKLVTTHTARRSFATNEYKAKTPVITIMAITGHKTETAFMRYIKVTPNEHAQILILAWKKRWKTKGKTKVIPLTA